MVSIVTVHSTFLQLVLGNRINHSHPIDPDRFLSVQIGIETLTAWPTCADDSPTDVTAPLEPAGAVFLNGSVCALRTATCVSTPNYWIVGTFALLTKGAAYFGCHS